MKVKFTEQIRKTTPVRAFFLILVKDKHTDHHADKQPQYPEKIGSAGNIVAVEQKIS